MKSYFYLLFLSSLLITCQSKQTAKLFQPKTIKVGSYLFTFDSSYELHSDSNNSNSGFIEGPGLKLKFIEGAVSKDQTNDLEDTTRYVVKIDSANNLFRKITYGKDTVNSFIAMILGDKADSLPTLFPNRFNALVIEVNHLSKNQRDEILKILLTGRLK
jgi:hypothetical protein